MKAQPCPHTCCFAPNTRLALHWAHKKLATIISSCHQSCRVLFLVLRQQHRHDWLQQHSAWESTHLCIVNAGAIPWSVAGIVPARSCCDKVKPAHFKDGVQQNLSDNHTVSCKNPLQKQDS